jgi:hypothetical protein
MKNTLLIVCLIWSQALYAQTFEKTYGANDETYSKVIPAIDGGYIMVGSTMFSGAPVGLTSDILIVKTDSNGVTQWSERLQSQLDDEAYWIIADTDSTYMICGNAYDNLNGKLDVSVIRIGLTGNIISQKLYHSYEAERMASQQKTKDGGSIIGGETLFDGSNLQIYLLKLDQSGNIEWSRAYGDADQEYGTFAIQTSDGGYAATGVSRINSFSSSICVVRTDSAGNQIWSKKFNTSPNYTKCLAFRIIETNNHGFVVAGSAYDTLSTISFFAMKLDSLGSIVWQNTYSTSNNDYVYDAISDSSGIVICGSETDMYGDNTILFKIDDLGNLKWQLGFDMPDSSMSPTSIYRLNDGKYLISGLTDANPVGNFDVMLIKTDTVYNQSLCNQFIPLFQQSPANLQAVTIDTFMVDTSTSINGNYNIASGFQENTICLGGPLKITETDHELVDVRLFEDGSGNIVLDPAQHSVDHIEIYDISGRLVDKIKPEKMNNRKIILTGNERSSKGIGSGVFIFRIYSEEKQVSFKLMLKQPN